MRVFLPLFAASLRATMIYNGFHVDCRIMHYAFQSSSHILKFMHHKI